MTARVLLVPMSTAATRVLAAPSGFVLSLGIYVGVVAILGSLWRTATAANGGSIAGYTAAALTWYIATSEAATIPLNTRLIEQFGEEVADGSVEVDMLRPASMVGVRVAGEIGRALPHLAVCIAAGVALATVAAGRPPSTVGAVLAVPALVLAIACNIVAQHAFAAASFWLRDARSTWFVYQKVVFIVGGMLLPLEVLPDTLARVAKVLPFMAMAYAPARLASGHVEPWLLLVQAAWLAVLGVLAVRVFARGERRLQVAGG